MIRIRIDGCPPHWMYRWAWSRRRLVRRLMPRSLLRGLMDHSSVLAEPFCASCHRLDWDLSRQWHDPLDPAREDAIYRAIFPPRVAPDPLDPAGEDAPGIDRGE